MDLFRYADFNCFALAEENCFIWWFFIVPLQKSD